MMDLLLESAFRSLALGGAVWLGLALMRVRNPHAQMTAWTVVLAASLSMPVLMHRFTVAVPAAAPLWEMAEVPGLPVPSHRERWTAAERAVVSTPQETMPPGRNSPLAPAAMSVGACAG
jgi:hypothetical protein